MTLTEPEMAEIKHKALGGERAAKLWNDAMNALHAYAHASGCPAGSEVAYWFITATERYQGGMTAAIRASHERNLAPSPDLEAVNGRLA